MTRLRTLIFFAGWISATLLLGIAGLPLLLSQRATWLAARLWVALSLFWLHIACGIKSRAEEVEHLVGARMIAANHQSAWDTLMLWKLLGNPVFVLKRELYWIPVFGWYLWRSGQIAINRAEPKGAIQQIGEQAAAQLREGRVLVMFPQGTRIPPGERGVFRSGVARTSQALQLPVVPAALNAGLFWPKRSLWKRPGTAVIRFLPPLAACEDTAPWLAQLEQGIMEEAERLTAAAAVELPVA